MTTTFQMEHDFPEISLPLFEKYLNHPDLCMALGQMPSFRARDLMESQALENGETLWKFKVVAGGEVPPAVQKLVSPDMFSWWENSKFVPKDHCIYWEIEPIVGKSKFTGKGKWQLKPFKKGTKRIIEGEFSVKVPLVGKIVETFLVSELKKNYEVEPEIQKKFYLKMKNLES